MSSQLTAMEYADMITKELKSQNILAPFEAFKEWVFLYSEVIIAQTTGQCEEYEQMLHKINSRSQKINNTYSAIGEIITEGLTQRSEDILGLVYANLAPKDKSLGQHFTPMHLAMMMAHANLTKEFCEEEIAKKAILALQTLRLEAA